MRIGTKADIWGLGCVWLEFVTWYIKGVQAIHDLYSLRSFHVAEGEYFLLSKDQDAATISPAVPDWIRGLCSRDTCTSFLHELLTYIKDKMLVVNYNKRETALEVSIKLKKLNDRAMASPA